VPGRLSTDVSGLRGKVKRRACIETRLSDLAGREETLTGCIESSVESNQKLKSTLGQNLCLSGLSNFAVDFQANSHGSVGRWFRGVLWGSESGIGDHLYTSAGETALRPLQRHNHMLGTPHSKFFVFDFPSVLSIWTDNVAAWCTFALATTTSCLCVDCQ
jgi:hypothetical protein